MLENYDPQAKSDPLLVFVNKSFIGTHYPHSFTYHVYGGFQAIMAELNICNRDWPQSQTQTTIWPLTGKAANHWIRMPDRLGLNPDSILMTLDNLDFGSLPPQLI